MIIHIADVWADAQLDHLRYLSGVLIRAHFSLENSTNPLDYLIANFLDLNAPLIRSQNQADLQSVVNNFDKTFPIESMKTSARKRLSRLIDYRHFSAINTARDEPWSAYHLCRKSRYKICPYCHLALIDTRMPINGQKGYRPDLDHFYPQGTYPYLALSLPNLIPSCGRCNGPQVKHDADFFLEKHLHPQVDPESINFELRLLPEYQHVATGTAAGGEKMENFEVFLDPACAAAVKSVDTFQLNERYQAIRDDLFRLRRQLRTARPRIAMMAHALPALDTEIDDTVGFCTSDSSYKQTIMGKAKLDLFFTNS